MGKFLCAYDASAETFCLSIAKYMMDFFGISEDEAIGRINEFFGNQKLNELAHHRVPEEWAKLIYYEDGAWYWVEKWMKENIPQPRPYPKK